MGERRIGRDRRRLPRRGRRPGNVPGFTPVVMVVDSEARRRDISEAILAVEGGRGGSDRGSSVNPANADSLMRTIPRHDIRQQIVLELAPDLKDRKND